ncbi:hypothetical protein BU104_14575 [Staphylococcus xylosus]|uniref:Competence protein ComK n=1 Tax=Staphylococcus xylosus TaxID=1288 RepID=A0AAQ0RVM3_STAXY|nr:hypothetical protein BU104_14575 [Staphylococcus xylosus]
MTHLPESIYVIRQGDMVIRPKYDEYQQTNGTEIIRFDQTRKESPFKVQRIIERSCKFYGNNYISKKAETNRITGISSKPPILLTPLFPTYFFQTYSYRQGEKRRRDIQYIDSLEERQKSIRKVNLVNGDA